MLLKTKIFLFFAILFISNISFCQTNANTWTWQSGNNLPDQVGKYGPKSISPGNRSMGGRWVYNDKLYLFSGSGYGHNDMWEYDHSTANWTWIKGTNNSNLPVFGTKNIEDPNNIPGGRIDCLSWIQNNKFYMFGGYGYDIKGDLGYLNDLWVYDPATNNWTWLTGSDIVNEPTSTSSFNTTPGSRAYSVSAVMNGKLVLFGGKGYDLNSNLGSLNDLWEYDVFFNIWLQRAGSGIADDPGIYLGNFSDYPSSRQNSSYWESNGDLYFMGGTFTENGNFHQMSDLWKYEYNSNQFYLLKGTNAYNVAPVFGQKYIPDPNNMPGSLFGGTSYAIGNVLYFFGGINESFEGYDALWRYDIGPNQWTWIKGQSIGGAIPVLGTIGVESPLNTPVIYTESGPPLSWVYQNKLFVFEIGNFKLNHWQLNNITENWTRIKTTIPEPVFGNIGLNNNNFQTIGERSEASTWEYNNKIYVFGGRGNGVFQDGYGGLYLNDLWQYDPITKLWSWISGSPFKSEAGIYGFQNIASPNNYPGGRKNAKTCRIGNKIYLFGGYGIDSFDDESIGPHISYLNDLWEYDLTTQLWTWLKGSNLVDSPGIYGTKGIADYINSPGARTEYSMVAINNKIYLYGGYGYDSAGNQGYLNDVWEYEPTTNIWKWLKGNNLVNNAGSLGVKNVSSITNEAYSCFGQATWVVNNKMYIFGGALTSLISGSYFSIALLEYNPITNIWTWLKGDNDGMAHAGVYGTIGVATNNNNPGSRYNGFSFAHEGKLFVFGGLGHDTNISNQSNLSDLWEYNLTSNNWKWIKGPNMISQNAVLGTQGVANINNNPAGLMFGSSNYFNNKFYVFGGYSSDIGRNADLWEYIPTNACTIMSTIASGNWNNAATWSCGRLPLATDIITINAHTVDLTGIGFAKNVIYAGNGNLRLGSSGNLVLNP